MIADDVAVLVSLAAAEEARRAVENAKQANTSQQAPLSAEPFNADTLRDLPPRHISEIEAALRDPWHAAIRMQIKIVGWRLYAKGGRDAMDQAFALMEQKIGGVRFPVMVDKAWDGIGIAGDPRGFWCA